METRISNIGNTWTATLSGKLDTIASKQFGENIAPLIENADKDIILDCTDLSYICSSGLRHFLILKKETEKKGGNIMIRLTAPNNELMRVLQITCFDKLFKIEQA